MTTRYLSLLAFGVALLCGLPLASGQAAKSGEPAPVVSAGQRKPAVLFLIRKVDPTFRVQLEQDGFVVHEQRAQDTNLTWDFLKQFNVLVLSEWCKRDNRTDLTQPPESSVKVAIPAIRQFLEKGGGVLANCAGTYAGTLPTEAAMRTSLLQEWGARVTSQSVTDPATEQRAGSYPITYLYTDQIDPASPVAAGVKGLWLGCGPKYGSTEPIQFGPEWTIVVKGSKSAVAKTNPISHPFFAALLGADPEFSGFPPLFGVRPYRAGRIAAQALGDIHGYGAGYFNLVGGIQMEKGIGGKPSDYGRLIVNTLTWLAEPSLKSGELGGYQPAAATASGSPPEVLARKAPDWKALGFPANFKNNYRGVVGLTSTHGGGKASVAEFATVAGKLGLDFIAFLDPLEKLGPEGWEALKTECKAASSDTLLVYPGMRYLDEYGNHLFVLADYLPWPDAFLTPERRMKFRTADAYFFLTYNEPVLGIYKTGTNPTPVWDMRLYNSLAVVTYESGKQMDECLGDYQYAVRNYLNLRPYAIDLIGSTAELETALREHHLLTVIPANSLNEVREQFFNGNRGRGYRWSAFSYISNGPRITAWRMLNDARVTSGDWWLKGTQRVRMRLQVESDVPLKEATVYNGSQVVRRFRGTDKTLSQDIEFTHDNQAAYTVVVEDAAGRRAISDDRVAVDFLLYDFYCGDRINTIPCSWVKAPQGEVVNQDYTCMTHGILWDSLLPGANRQTLAPPGGYIDFAGLAGPNGPLFRVIAQEGREEFYIRKIDRVMTSADVLIKTSSIHHKCPEGGPWLNGWHQMPPPRPTELIDVDYRMTWYPYRFAGLATGLMEGVIKFKKDVTLKGPTPIFYISQYSKVEEGKYDHYQVRTPEQVAGGKVPLEGERPAGSGGTFPSGSYVSLFPAIYGSSTVFAMSDGLSYFHSAGKTDNRAEVRMGQYATGEKVKAGTEWRFKLLGLRGLSTQPADNREAENFRRYFFGVDGKKGYEIAAKHGQVKESVFPLELAADGGFFQGQVKAVQDPGLDLPLQVGGFDLPWSVILYDCAKNRLRFLGVENGNAYCALDLREVKGEFTIGYPVTTENPQVVVTLVDEGEDHYSVELHNPTGQLFQTTLTTAAWLTGLIPARTEPVTLPPGSSRLIKLR